MVSDAGQIVGHGGGSGRRDWASGRTGTGAGRPGETQGAGIETSDLACRCGGRRSCLRWTEGR